MAEPRDRTLGLSVIIPVRDGIGYLPGCLRSLAESSHAAAEIIVADDGSRDGSAELAERYGARVVTLPESGGPGAARNAGARVATQPVLLFLDADVVVHPDTLYRAYQALTSNDAVGAVFGAYDDTPLAPGLVSQYRNLLHHFTHSTAKRKASTFWAGCGIIRRDLFLRHGGFDRRYRVPSVEDAELGLRMSAAGVEIRLDPEIQVGHAKSWTLWTMTATDVVRRAWPWSQLILGLGSVPDDLNFRREQRAAALCAWAAAGCAIASIKAPASILAAVLAVTAVAFCLRRLLACLARVKGAGFAVRAFPLHFWFLLYSSATFGVATVVFSLRSRQRAPAAVPEVLE